MTAWLATPTKPIVERDALSHVKMLAEFKGHIALLIVPGTTVLATMAPVNKRTTGAGLAVLASNQ